ncbi:TetR/AcrR family transcriptional regulator [Pontibacter qinzhouensis]|uniref:TetR/AcrR family transcriptional regulator n=1 Tax=Pontibacter qinzhouensis TaxID=2603253 RepID=A0A5C8K8S6_9BACT|nr:TetR/AcrR family transcriptional regulator [Pontibacter qinzhouensis]TXK46450.1 TetR/AcrR family transcriptional regulator [Pontibacter qinzhouensis]
MTTTSINIRLTHKSYLREPESTELGRRIISESVRLIDELGFEQFTFKKLAAEIGSTEASVYRYFENKHKLLVYLVSWYWAWLDYSVTLRVQNIDNPRERLIRAILAITTAAQEDDPTVDYIDERMLYRIVLAESTKVYHTKEVDSENQDGYFMEFKNLCDRMARMTLAINPAYPYPHALMSTVLEAAHQQMFFARHLPSLTEICEAQHLREENTTFLKHLVFSAIEPQEANLTT